MLPRHHRQEALSRAYIQAIAACCGMTCAFRDFDYGLDMTLHEIARVGSRYVEAGRRLDVQAKSTTLADLRDDHVVYDLDASAYELLRTVSVDCPRILVLLVMPEDEAGWSFHSEERLEIRHCAYWMALKGRESVPNHRSVRLAIPRKNVFSPAELSAIMNHIRLGEDL